MNEIIIIGSGSHSKVVYNEILNLDNYKVLGFYNPLSSDVNSIEEFCQKKYLQYFHKHSIKNILRKKVKLLICVGNNSLRESIYYNFAGYKKKINWAKVISINAKISNDVKIGKGSVIMSSVTVQSGTIIGSHCIINSSCSIDHDNNFKNFSSCAPGVITGGNVKVGKKTFIGIGSILSNNVNIGNEVIIGANSLILKDCKKNSIFYGSPAKFIKKTDKNINYF